MQDLDKFKNEMNLSGQNVYVGHRYVPKIVGEWDNTNLYEPLSIVQYQGNSFTSRQYVPVGVEITNEDFWVSTGNYNAQIEQYRKDVTNVSNNLGNLETLETPLKGNIVESINSLKKIVSDFKDDHPITPEDFEGDDHEKLQLALNAAIENDRTLQLNRMYDITGKGSIMVNKQPDIGNRKVTYITGSGGGIIKEDSGYIFDAPNVDIGDINITNVRFKSIRGNGTTVWNGNKIIRINSMLNDYIELDRIIEAKTRYLQSTRFEYEHIVYGDDWAFDFEESWDVSISNNLIENRKGGITNSSKSTAIRNRNLRIQNNVIEGLTGQAISLSSSYSTIIHNNYLESNRYGDIDLATLNDYYHVGLSVKNNMISIHDDRPDDQAIKVGSLQSADTIDDTKNFETTTNAPSNHFEGNVSTGFLYSKTGSGRIFSTGDYETKKNDSPAVLKTLGLSKVTSNDSENYSDVSTSGIVRRYQRYAKFSMPSNATQSFDITITNGQFYFPVKNEDMISVVPLDGSNGADNLRINSFRPIHVSPNSGKLRINATNLSTTAGHEFYVVINIWKMYQ